MHSQLFPSRCFRLLILVSLLFPPVLVIHAAEDKPSEAAKSDESKDEKKGDDSSKKSKIKKYDEVITTNAVTKSGLFRVHKIEEKLYYEIPVEAFDTDMLWVTQISETTAGSSYAGMPVGDRVVRWEQHGEQVLLRDVHYDIRADTTDAIAKAVKESNLAPIIRVFDIKAYGRDKAPVIEVIDLFKKEVRAPNLLRRILFSCRKKSFSKAKSWLKSC